MLMLMIGAKLEAMQCTSEPSFHDCINLVSSSLLENDHGHPGQVHAYGFSPV